MKLIIKCGTLFDATGSEPGAKQCVVIEDGKIAEVISFADFDRRADLKGVQTVDASSHWVMPGLINAHDHLVFRDLIGPVIQNMRAPASRKMLTAVRNSLTALKRGWTTIRDMGADHNLSFQVREYIAEGSLPGPRVIACGRPISVTGGHSKSQSVQADGPDEMRKAARSQLDLGADFIKVAASHDPIVIAGPEKTRAEMTLDEMRAAFEEAHAWGKLTGCHCMGTKALERVLDAEVDVISHGFYLNDELAQRMVEQGVYLDPTLSSYGRQTMNPALRRGKVWGDLHKPLLPAMEGAMRAAVRAGVKIVTGTDSAGRYAEDVEMMREFGLDPIHSLLACTRHAAEAAGIGDVVGTVTPGKVADLVILGGNPLEDPYKLEDVVFVVQGGTVFKPEDIALGPDPGPRESELLI
jgi:imidazolonepropionase-like amidohydrolase